MVNNTLLEDTLNRLQVETARVNFITKPGYMGIKVKLDHPFDHILKGYKGDKATLLRAAEMLYRLVPVFPRDEKHFFDGLGELRKIIDAKNSVSLTSTQLKDFHTKYLDGLKVLYEDICFKFPQTLHDDQSKLDKDYKSRPAIIMRAPDDSNQSLRTININLERRFRWEALRRVLEEEGARVIVVEPSRSYITGRNEVFPRDPLFIDGSGNIYLPSVGTRSNFQVLAHEQPGIVAKIIEEGLVRSEKPYHKKMTDMEIRRNLETFTSRFVEMQHCSIEWGNVVYDKTRNIIFLGVHQVEGKIHPYSALNALEIARVTGIKVVPVPLTQPKYYHLDTFMRILEDGVIEIYPHATNEEGIRNILDATGLKYENLKILKEGQASKLGANSVSLPDKKVILTSDDEEMERDLIERGFMPVSPKTYNLPFDTFAYGDGGVHCLTLEAYALQEALQRRNEKGK